MEYKPKVRHRGINIPFGYYVCPTDPTVLIPDPKKLDCLHYAFRMRAKYNTPLRDCTQWLHMATGQRMTASGFMYAFKHWLGKLRKEKSKELAAQRKKLIAEKQKFIDENFKHFGIRLDDKPDITAVAHFQAKKENKQG